MTDIVEAAFETQLSKWEMYDPDRYELRHGLVQSDDSDLDRKALDNWNPEWGARA